MSLIRSDLTVNNNNNNNANSKQNTVHLLSFFKIETVHQYNKSNTKLKKLNEELELLKKNTGRDPNRAFLPARVKKN